MTHELKRRLAKRHCPTLPPFAVFRFFARYSDITPSVYFNRIINRREIIIGDGECASILDSACSVAPRSSQFHSQMCSILSRCTRAVPSPRPADRHVVVAGHASEMGCPINFFLSVAIEQSRKARLSPHDRHRVRAARLSRTSAVPRRVRRACAARLGTVIGKSTNPVRCICAMLGYLTCRPSL